MKLFSILVIIVIFIIGYLHLPMFGRLPKGERLTRIEKSINYRDGSFQNIHATKVLNANFLDAVKNIFSRFCLRLDPIDSLPSIKVDLKSLDPNEDVLIWFGHSSYFLYLNGKSILIDPLFSEVSSPVLFWPAAFKGTNSYKIEDMPDIDYLLITHDHWDHLDYESVTKLKPKIKKVICGLGVGEHFEYWGFDKDCILEMDWTDEASFDKDFSIYCLPARHFSGRGILFNKTLWVSFLIKVKDFSLYIGGDSGYDTHYAEIGKQFGSIDLAILDSGQHDEKWKYIHMLIYEVIAASRDLGAKKIIPSHICKLSLANHRWNEPYEEISRMSCNENFSVLTPMIGEKIKLRSNTLKFAKWWKRYK